MKQYICSICGYVYDEEKNVKWEDLPDDWKCPLCGAGKDAFILNEQTSQDVKEDFKPEVEKELSPMEISIICSNLARGCEKQYLFDQAKDFEKLAEFFKSEVKQTQQPNMKNLLDLIENDLSEGYSYANKVANQHHDRGALRSLVWSEKVTRMLYSLLSRYEVEGENMLENTGVYVCTVCGFVYVGDDLPELCPVCKVPAWKFEKVERRTNK